jgi:perosamine synthetase
MTHILLSKPVFTEEMKEVAIDALQNEFFILGESVFKFEEEFARFTGTKHAIAVNSGTTALSLSLIALGVGNSDKVMTTPMSFVATANAIVHANGRPVFSDVAADTGNLDPGSIKSTNGVKGIIPVHLYGNPCNMDKLMEYKEKGLFILEDACQAHGASLDGKKAGSIGGLGCFSFYSIKNMTVGGDGGMITTSDDDLAARLRILRDCGRISKYEHTMIGYTARLNTVNAAIGRVQLKYLDQWNDMRRHIAGIYRKHLPEEILLRENGKSVYHIFAIRTDKRDAIATHLKKFGIDTGVHYPLPIHLQPVYRELYGYKEGDYPESERLSREELSLPIYPGLTDDEARFVCEKIREVL